MIAMLLYVLGTLIIITVVYYGAIPVAAFLVKRKSFLWSPKKGCVQLRKRVEKIIEYRGNTFDQEKFVVKETGEIKSIYILDADGKKTANINPQYKELKEEMKSSILYQWLGTFWMGTDTLFAYMFDEKIESGSIFIKNVRIIKIVDAETEEKSLASMILTVDLETTHAGTALNYKDGLWLKTTEAAIESACRDFIALHSYDEITKEQIEGKSELLDYIMGLNTSIKGNSGLPFQVGQKITKVSIGKISVDKEMEGLMKAPIIAKKKAEAVAETAEGEAKAIKTKADANAYATRANAKANLDKARKESEGNEALGKKENAILKERADILGKDEISKYEEAKSIGKLENLSGVLSYRSGGQPQIIVKER